MFQQIYKNRYNFLVVLAVGNNNDCITGKTTQSTFYKLKCTLKLMGAYFMKIVKA